ncbi:MAG TPA: PH domain-containing protein [Candidatus Saccharibacteria bacterium]|nr:PH domain-containing protein [Candidatus Saccharibacteria bacterium]HMT56130.1 PH domain-containing protein [Candidatus Saccharibacteria bacterium]
MVHIDEVMRQLRALNLQFRVFGNAEVRELALVLNEQEHIQHCIYGYYQGGSALLVATSNRLLLIDKRPFFLNLEDVRYEMITDVRFAGRLLDATVFLQTSGKSLLFRSFADKRLRVLCGYIQDQITRARQLEHMLEDTRPAGVEWRPYSLVNQRRRISKFAQPIRP